MNHITHSADQRRERFISNATAVHGNKYDYSKVVYTTAQKKVEIICPEHGSFWQIPDSHRLGRGCKKCAAQQASVRNSGVKSEKKTTEQFIESARKVHGNRYDYSKSVYTGKQNKLIITCPEHGDFEQIPNNHYEGAGCPVCGIKKAHTHFLNTTEQFIAKAKSVHGDKYDYSVSEYLGKDKPIKVSCPTHGIFQLKKAWHHYLGHKVGCPLCSMAGTSRAEMEVASFVKAIAETKGLEVITNDRTIIKPLELDIVIPELKLAIEFDGLYWHSEQAGKPNHYHLMKTQACNKAGYRLIHIFEDEWNDKEEIVKSRLSHILGVSSKKYYARKLVLGKPSKAEVDAFFERTHIQGRCSFSLAYGLYTGEGELVACMTFGANRFSKEREMELIRYSTSGSVTGGFSRLLNAFKRENPSVPSITSYSDRRWSQGGVYSKNGFRFVHSSAPGYFYSNTELRRINRVVCQKHKLPALLGDKFDENKSEVKNMIDAGYFRIFDVGMDKWILNLH